MDNNGLMQAETLEIHETTHSMNFIPEKPEEVPTHEENGHVTIEACELPCIDVMLESSVQNDQENSAPIMYENTKQQYEPEGAEKIVTECEDSEFPAGQNQVQLDNISAEVEETQVLDGQEENQVVEMHESQVMEVHDEGQVIIEATEALSFETTNESINEQENTHIEHEEVLQECVLEGENGDLNPDEYTTEEVENANQFEGVIHEGVTEYVSEDYVQKEDTVQQTSDTPIETAEFAHLPTTTEIQLSTEEMVHEEPQEQSFTLAAEESYEEATVVNTEEAEIIEEEPRPPITYSQQNIINIAAASANIDMQDDADIEIEQEEPKLLHTEVASSVEGVNIILNSGETVEESVLQKGQEESTSEVIEEIYFIQDVSGENLEVDKDVNEVETVVTISQSTNVQSEAVTEADLSIISQNSGISEKSRNVIQDIFDDWGDENVDENVEEDNEVSFKDQDSVEIELNNLLNEKKKSPVSKEMQGTSKGSVVNNTEINKPEGNSIPIVDTESSKKTVRNSSKDIPSYVQPYLRGDDSPGGTNSKRKMPSPRLGVKVPSRFLKSQIASPAEVSEVLKERIREQQKDFEKPQAADIVFVKKLTQRFASKICPGGTMPVPGLIPLSMSPRITSDSTLRSENSKQSNENTDNRELLAILEGDVDPDWSNLKSQSSADDTPETEGDISLSVEIPKIANKRGRKKSINVVQSKVQEIEKTPKREVKKDIPKVKEATKSETVKPKDTPQKPLENDLPRKPLKEKDSQNTTPVTPHTEMRIDETRSGRKRKPTEKALEQYASKRQKIFKAKTPSKKDLPENSADKTSSVENREDAKSLPETPETSTLKEATGKQITADKSTPLKKDKLLIEKKRSPVKDTPPSGTLKKIPAKKLISQKALSLKKSSISLQSKLSSPVRPVGRPPKGVTESVAKPVLKAQGRPKKTEAPAKPKKKGSNKEIDRLLQDEGVVNLLYDVGQPRTRRLIPITQTQKKTMDIEKAERDLDLRKKLVKSAVLRLRGSNSETDKVAPRSKRTPLVNTEPESSAHHGKSSGSAMTSPTEFIYPAKIRNAADASVIVRRHSSSSFSSVSGSPRVSIDGPIDGFNDDHHGLRSTKRKHSIDKDAKHLDIKRVKQRALQNSESARS